MPLLSSRKGPRRTRRTVRPGRSDDDTSRPLVRGGDHGSRHYPGLVRLRSTRDLGDPATEEVEIHSSGPTPTGSRGSPGKGSSRSGPRVRGKQATDDPGQVRSARPLSIAAWPQAYQAVAAVVSNDHNFERGVWVPRTVSQPLIRAFTVGRPRVMVGSPPSMIASCGLTTRLSDARPGAELAGTATSIRYSQGRGDPGAPARGRRAPPRQSTPDGELVSCAGDPQETASSALTSCILCSDSTERIVSDKDPVGGQRCSAA